jgi:hypothetical protein
MEIGAFFSLLRLQFMNFARLFMNLCTLFPQNSKIFKIFAYPKSRPDLKFDFFECV